MNDKIANFSTFYSQAVKDKSKRLKKGKYKGQLKSVTHMRSDNITLPGVAYTAQPSKNQAPSASTYTVRG